MKTYILLLSLILSLFGFVVRAAESVATLGDHLYVINAANVKTSLVERVISFERSLFALEYVVENVEASKVSDLASAANLRSEVTNSFIRIVLFDAPREDIRHGIFDPTNRVMVLNTRVLRHDTEETFARRLDRQFTRGICFSLGLPTCPSPMCGLYPYADIEELDHIGRGPCPPCYVKALQSAQAKNITLARPVPRPAVKDTPRKAPGGGPSSQSDVSRPPVLRRSE